MKPRKKGDKRKEKNFNKNSDKTAKENQQAASEVGQINTINKTGVANVTNNVKQESLKVDVAALKPVPVDTKIESADDSQERKYHKRQIKSNWNRYDLPDGDDDEEHQETTRSPLTTRGYDFSFLQTVGGGVGSQFRFQDERDWAEDVDASKSESLNQFQLLDTHDLALSISCIPLQKRLNIAAEYFTQEQLLKFEKAAIASQEIFQQQTSTTTTVKSAEQQTLNSPHISEQYVNDATAQLDGPEETNLFANENDTITSNIDDNNETMTSDLTVYCQIQTETKEGNELEDELDALLNLNMGTKRPYDIEINPIVAFSQNLDANVSTSQPPMKMPDISDLPKQRLEDWLDDFLSD